MNNLDYYEGISSNLFERVETKIYLKDNRNITAFIYIPTEQTIFSEKLTIEIDPDDRWVEEIKKFPDIVKEFPELLFR